MSRAQVLHLQIRCWGVRGGAQASKRCRGAARVGGVLAHTGARTYGAVLTQSLPRSSMMQFAILRAQPPNTRPRETTHPFLLGADRIAAARVRGGKGA